MKDNFKKNYIIICSIATPLLCFVIIYLITAFSNRPSQDYSTYRQAIKHFEAKDQGPTQTMLSSNLFQSRAEVEQAHDYSQVSTIEIFNDKISLPQKTLSYNFKELEIEHKKILKDLAFTDKLYDKIFDLRLSFRITIAYLLEKNPGELTYSDFKNSQISDDHLKFLEQLSQSSDFLLLLEQNRLTSTYLQFENLKKVYGLDEDQQRTISSEE